MDKNSNILAIVRGEINDFMYNSIEIVPGYTFNQYDTIKRCHLYINSRFEDNSMYQGREKMFDNKIKPKRDRVAAFLNIDTKDIKVISRSGSENPYKTLVAQKELDNYLKENDFAQKFNDMCDAAVDFGSVVLKKTSEKTSDIVDLRRFFCDPTVNNLQKSRFVTFKYLFTSSELRAKVKDGWDKDVIEEIIEKKERNQNTGNAGTSYETNGQVNMIRSTPYIEVYERFGEVEKGLLNNQKRGWDKELVRSLFITAEPMWVSKTDIGEYAGENGGVLFKSKWSGDWPVDEFHYYKTPGRWLGIGVVEQLFIPQERINELVNQKRVSMELSTLHLFQSKDPTVVQNVLTDLVNGDIMITSPNGEITPLVNEERNLSAFQSEEIYYQASIDALSFVSPQLGGEAVPSSTPATNAVIQQNNANSVFSFKRQNYANFIRRYMRKQVLKDLLRKMSQEHILRFVGDYEDMMKLYLGVATSVTNNETIQKMLNGNIVSPEEYQASIEKNMNKLRGKNELHLMVNAGWFDDVDLDFDILIDNEQQSTDIIANNTYQLIQVLMANPAWNQDPAVRALVMDYAEKVGINPSKIDSMTSMQAQQPAQGGQVPNAEPQPAEQVGQGATRETVMA